MGRASSVLQSFAATLTKLPRPLPTLLLPFSLLASHYYNKILQRFFLSIKKAMLKEMLKIIFKQVLYMKSLFFLAFWFHLTLRLQRQKSLFLTAADSFQHNTLHLQNSSRYLFNKHCIENNFTHSKATNDKQTERGGKNSYVHFSFHFLLGLDFILPSCLFWTHVKRAHPIPK